MSNTIAKVWQELVEVSASLSCAKDKLTSKLDEVVANMDKTNKTKKAFKDHMFDTRKEVNMSKDKITEVQQLVYGLQMRISEIGELTSNTSNLEFANKTCHHEYSVVNINKQE